MTNWLRIAAAICLLALLAPAGHAVTDAAEKRRPVSTIYDLYLGGIKAGELTIDAEFRGDSYSAASVMRTAGIVGMLYNASFEAEAEGRLSGEALEPGRFQAASRSKGKEQVVEMAYSGRKPAVVRAEPAFVPKPWQIEPSAQIGTLDPITAALTALAPVPVNRICRQDVEVFDGRRRYAIEFGDPVADGERIRCPAVYRRVAGFKPKMMKKRAEFPFSVWYEVRSDGLAQVVRGAGDSLYGLAVVLLRE